MAEDPLTVRLDGREVRLSSPSKVLFGSGATKKDLCEYYQTIAEPLLRAIAHRPVLMQRYPKGASGPSFFQKRVPNNAPDWLTTTTVSTVNNTTSQALVAADLAHVIWAVNLGCLGFHVWPTFASNHDHVNELRLDLDPQPGTDFATARRAAHLTRELLDESSLTSFVKTSGKRGIHVYVPLAAQWDAYQVRAAAVAVARELERREPELITAAWWREERGARVFVDYNQNAPHKTMFGAYGVRARPGAQVSAPVYWDELDTIDPDELTIATVPARIAAEDDPWEPKARLEQSLEPLLVLHRRDREAGLLDAPWPPEYPKMPDEPLRISPSRARKDSGDGADIQEH